MTEEKYSNQELNLNSKEVVARLFDLEDRVDRLEGGGTPDEEVEEAGSAPANIPVSASAPDADSGAEVREPTFFTDDTAGAGGSAPADVTTEVAVDPVETSARLV